MPLLSCFSPKHKQVTTELASRRNELVAALADEAVAVHAAPRGHIARLID